MSILSLVTTCVFSLLAHEGPAPEARPGSVPLIYSEQGGRWIETPDGATQIKVLLDATNGGGAKLEVAFFSMQPGTVSPVHAHGVIEAIYVLTGELIQVLDPGGPNERFQVTGPGMMTSVPKAGKVIHWTPEGKEPLTGLIIWSGGGEVDRLTAVLPNGTWRNPFHTQKTITLPDSVRAAMTATH